MKLDLDIAAGGTLPLSSQFLFPSDNSDGALVCMSGSLTVVLFAPQTVAGAGAVAIGKLVVQFKEIVSGAPSDYTYRKVSAPLYGS